MSSEGEVVESPVETLQSEIESLLYKQGEERLTKIQETLGKNSGCFNKNQAAKNNSSAYN